MDACKPIQFYTPGQLAAQLVAIVAMGAAMLAMFVIFA